MAEIFCLSCSRARFTACALSLRLLSLSLWRYVRGMHRVSSSPDSCGLVPVGLYRALSSQPLYSPPREDRRTEQWTVFCRWACFCRAGRGGQGKKGGKMEQKQGYIYCYLFLRPVAGSGSLSRSISLSSPTSNVLLWEGGGQKPGAGGFWVWVGGGTGHTHARTHARTTYVCGGCWS